MANEWKSKISAIFAEQGDTVDIPVETQADNQVSFATGYTKNYNKDAKDDLGNPLVKFGIERTKFNYLFKIITSAIKELQETLPVYTTDTDEQKVDVGAIVENTVAFNALTKRVPNVGIIDLSLGKINARKIPIINPITI